MRNTEPTTTSDTAASLPPPARKGPLRRILANWRERHQHPFSFAIHLIGIPMTVAAFPFLLFGEWWWFAGLFVGGYALQFVGHAVEGNDAGEWVLVKRCLGLPYTAISPRYGGKTVSGAGS